MALEDSILQAFCDAVPSPGVELVLFLWPTLASAIGKTLNSGAIRL